MILHKINIEFTDNPKDLRNNGLGDYAFDDQGNKVIRVYCKEDTPKWRQWAFMCAMHELTEFELTQARGIQEPDIDKFDAWFESQDLEGEPGDHPLSVYRKEHRSAEFIERYLCEVLGLIWSEYWDNYKIPE